MGDLQVIIMRGIAGSGKTTYVRKHFPEAFVVSADHFFERDGEYRYDRVKAGEAHADCFARFCAAVEQRKPLIVVDNTNTQRWEFERYLYHAIDHGYEVRTVALTCESDVAVDRNVHGVPKEAVYRMAQRMQLTAQDMVVNTTEGEEIISEGELGL